MKYLVPLIMGCFCINVVYAQTTTSKTIILKVAVPQPSNSVGNKGKFSIENTIDEESFQVSFLAPANDSPFLYKLLDSVQVGYNDYSTPQILKLKDLNTKSFAVTASKSGQFKLWLTRQDTSKTNLPKGLSQNTIDTLFFEFYVKYQRGIYDIDEVKKVVTETITKVWNMPSDDKFIGKVAIGPTLEGKKPGGKSVDVIKLDSKCKCPKKEQICSCSTIKKYQIDSVKIAFFQGSVAKKGLLVFLSNGTVFRNMSEPISLTKKNSSGYNLKLVNQKNPKEFIRLADVISYTQFGKFYYPDDNEVTLKPDTILPIYAKSSIKDIADVTVFTDVLALLGRKANGLVQTEFSTHFITNTDNFKKTDLTLFHDIRVNLALSKFDSKFQQFDSTRLSDTGSFTSGKRIDRLYINQIAYLRAGLKLNIFKLGLWPKQQINLSIGGNISLTNGDSLFKKDIVTANYFLELMYKINRMENFGLDVNARYIWQKLSRSFDDVPIKITNKGTAHFFNPSFTMYYYPFTKGGSDNKIYLRCSYFADLDDARSNFPQIQIGYKASVF